MPTVAVLPFVAAGNDPEQSDFARSLTHEVSAYLSTSPYVQIRALEVVVIGPQAFPRAGVG
jgi:TolB-like protein